VKFQQELDYPTVPVEIDRERAGLSGVSAQQVANAVVVSSSSSRYRRSQLLDRPEERRQLPGPG